MDIINSIASWSGWAPLVAILVFIGIVGAWFYEKRVELLKDENEATNRKLQDCLNYSPDVVAKRLSERHKLLSEEIEFLNHDKEHNEIEISQLEKQLAETKEEANLMRIQLEQVHEILIDLGRPRGGKVKPNVVTDILKTVDQQGMIYFPIAINRELSDDFLFRLNNNHPFRIEVEFPGMFRMYINVYDNENNKIGRVYNPHVEIYYQDYYESLLEVLKLVPNKNWVNNFEGPSESFIVLDSEFHGISLTDPSVIYVKVPFDKNILAPQRAAG